MVNSKHSVKMKSTIKLVLRSSSTNINDSQAIVTTSGTNEDENSVKTLWEKINMEKTWNRFTPRHH